MNLSLEESSTKMGSQDKTWITYPSQNIDPQTNIEDIIASQNIISRVMHAYMAVFVPLGLLAGICIMAALIKSYGLQKSFSKLDLCLLCLAITEVTILLFSITVIARPGYMEITNLSCGVLAFLFNISYFNTQYLQVMFIFIFLLNKGMPNNPLLIKVTQRPLLCVLIIIVFAFCSSLTVVALLGTVSQLHEIVYCQLDPLNAAPSYDIGKFCLGFGIPSLFMTLLLVLICVKLARSKDFTWKEISHTGRMLIPISIIMFTCRLFYNTLLIRRTISKLQRQSGSIGDELVMNIAEIVMFSQSCFSLVIIMLLHRPCKELVHQMWTSLTQLCKPNERVNNTNVPSEPEEAENVAMTGRNLEQQD
ncbi:uncharacterized protein [Pleurodeles waltl]|uniref:uncharacterized protein n=1 Tax=Pleurodeles waltl TaxID=8319 RepID=UPI0037097E66